MAVGAYPWMLAQLGRHISVHAWTFGLTGNVWFESSDICLCHNTMKMQISLVSMRWPLWHGISLDVAQLGRVILTHAQTFGLIWNVQFGTSSDIFCCWNTIKMQISLVFMKWPSYTNSEIGPIRKDYFGTCFYLWPYSESQIQPVFKGPVHTTRKKLQLNWTELDHQLQFGLFRNEKLHKTAHNWIGLNWLLFNGTPWKHVHFEPILKRNNQNCMFYGQNDMLCQILTLNSILYLCFLTFRSFFITIKTL